MRDIHTESSPGRIAVLLPCYNEGLVIRKVVEDFHRELPTATIYVYDNRSTDNTSDEARAAGAVVRVERWPGKGNVVRRMFSDIDAGLTWILIWQRVPAAFARVPAILSAMLFTWLANRHFTYRSRVARSTDDAMRDALVAAIMAFGNYDLLPVRSGISAVASALRRRPL